MVIMGLGPENKTQLYFRDDNTFVFVRRAIKYSCLVEKEGDVLKRAWKHFYSCQIPFPRYRNIKSALVSLGFSRDIILDPFNKVPTAVDGDVSKKPGAGDAMKKWIANIAENQRHVFRAKRESTVWTSRITWAFLGVLTVEVLVWAFIFVRKNYGG